MGGKVYSTLAYSLWNYFTVFFDYIPKIMYFLYAAVASCLDAMQLLMRRLAGLDVYYVNRDTGGIVSSGTGSAVSGDPVMEFIYGILGIGENAGSYQALNTTFWSLAIFAVIVLVVSTMIALIKSHYQEDGAKTAPLQYIYTAIKAILTFCIVPFAVIIGLMTSNFLLSTLDSITAGSGTEEALVGIYGPEATTLLRAHTDENGNRYYSRYDFFGFGEAANSTTFSGALFKAAAYEANRVRIGEIGSESGGDFTGIYNFNGLFGSGSSGYAAATDKREYVAYQIDYAFQNNFDLVGFGGHAMEIYASQKGPDLTTAFLTISSIDVFGIAGFVNNFSKYNVGLVWAYYNLWKFNFMVGIASIIVCFGIFISIIIGLMSRLIKSIILFLIYAPTLGLAPMDDFGAFKKWRTEFIQQILMAFGSVIGMNIFFLVLPYINNIAFFNIYLIDAIVSVVVMVTGLMIIKSLISFFSGLVGGADALKEGDDLKGDVGKTLGSAAKWTVGSAALAMKGGQLFAPGRSTLTKFVGGKISQGLAAWNKKRADILNSDANAEEGAAGTDTAMQNLNAALDEKQLLEEVEFDEAKKGRGRYYAEFAKAKALARMEGADEDTAEERGQQAIVEAMKKDTANADYQGQLDIIKNMGFANSADKTRYEKAQKLRKRAGEYSARQKAISESHYLNENGKFDKTSLHQSMANALRSGGGILAKALLEGLLPALKIDLGKISGITRFASNKKYDDKGNFIGYYWAPKHYTADDRGKAVDIEEDYDKKFKRGVLTGLSRFAAVTGGNKIQKPDKSTEKQTLEATQENARIAEQSSKQQIKLLREILKKLP